MASTVVLIPGQKENSVISQSLACKVPGVLGWTACEFSVGVMEESWVLGCFPKALLACFLHLDTAYFAALVELRGGQM